MDNTKNFNCISFCTGYAGIELGLERVIPNFRPICLVEVEMFACANLVAKIEEGKLAQAPIWTDLKTFDGRPFRDRVHLITGGYPCQPFSQAGQRKGEEDPRHLWPYIEEHIDTIRPVWVFFENVSGHLTLGFREVYQSLQGLGYKVEAGLFSAEEVGAPHKRQRLFILAYRIGSGAGKPHIRSRVQWQRFLPQESDNGDEVRSNTTGSGELGNTKHNGHATKQIIRCDEEAGNQGTSEEQEEAFKSSGASRFGNVQGIQGSAGRSKQLADTTRNDEQGCNIRQRKMQSGGSSTQPKELAESNQERLQGFRSNNSEERWEDERRQVGLRNRTKWPARPNHPQYEWEEPRTTEPRMGRTVDGFASRVDELRLLGNGVVPQTAELAFRTLMDKF